MMSRDFNFSFSRFWSIRSFCCFVYHASIRMRDWNLERWAEIFRWIYMQNKSLWTIAGNQNSRSQKKRSSMKRNSQSQQRIHKILFSSMRNEHRISSADIRNYYCHKLKEVNTLGNRMTEEIQGDSKCFSSALANVANSHACLGYKLCTTMYEVSILYVTFRRALQSSTTGKWQKRTEFLFMDSNLPHHWMWT